MAILNYIAFSLVLISSIVYPFLHRTLVVGGVGKDVQVKGLSSCKMVGTKEVEGCEDISIHHASGFALLSCGNLAARAKWFPPIVHMNADEARPGPIFSMSLKDKKIQKLKLTQFPNVKDFTPHGLDTFEISPSELLVAIINHAEAGSVVELFKYEVGSQSLVHVKIISHPLITTPNSLVIVSADGEMYITNDHQYATGAMRFIEEATRRPWGSLLYYDGKGDVSTVARLPYPNGVTFSPHQNLLYISCSTDGSIRVYERKLPGKLEFKDTIEVDFMPDNLKLDPATGHIYIGGFPKLLGFLAAVKGIEVSSKIPFINKVDLRRYSTVARISNNTAADIYYGKKYRVETLIVDNGQKMEISTVGAPDSTRKVVLVGGLVQKGIAVCKI